MMSKTQNAAERLQGRTREAKGRYFYLWLTPALAEALFAHNYEDNRNLKPGAIATYSRSQKNKEWSHQTGQALKCHGDWDAPDMVLMDGQNRLTACMGSGESFWIEVIDRLPLSAFNYIDRNVTRRTSDVLKTKRFKNPHYLAAMGKILVLYQKGTIRSMYNMSKNRILGGATDDEILEYVENNHDLLLNAFHDVKNNISNTGVSHHISGLAPAYYLFRRLSVEHAENILMWLRTGKGMTPNNPVYVMRDVLLDCGRGKRGTKYRNYEIFIMMVATWNALVTRKWTSISTRKDLTDCLYLDNLPASIMRPS